MHNGAMSQKRTRTSAVVLSAILCACGQSKEPQNNARAKQLDSAQAACIRGAMKRQTAQDAEFAVHHAEAMAALRSSVHITLAQRRANEQICLEYAKCLSVRDSALSEVVVSAMFDSCLRDVEREP
jgi:hypothetical protein